MCLDSNYNLFHTYDNFYIYIIDMFYYSIFDLNYMLCSVVVLLNLHLQSHEILSAVALALSLLLIILNALTSLLSF